MIEVKNNGKIIIDGNESNFFVQELVPKQVYKFFGNSSIWFMDETTIKVIQFIREYFGESMTINNWNNGGKFQYRGFRPDPYYYSKGEGGVYTQKKKGLYSQHRYGRGFDCNLSKTTPDQMREEVMKNQDAFLDVGLTTIEDGKYAPTWFHGDCRNTGKNTIFVVKP